LREATRLHPDSSEAHYNLGFILNAKSELDEAIAEYTEAVRLNPGFLDARYSLSDALLRKGRLDEALAGAREVTRLKPDVSAAHQLIGRVLEARGDLDGAIVEYREAVRFSDDVSEHHFLGAALYRKGDMAGAALHLRRAIRHAPSAGFLHHHLGLALRAQGDLDGAIERQREVIRLGEGPPEAQRELNELLVLKGNTDQVISTLREAIRLRPDDAETHYQLGELLLKAKGDVDGAIAMLRKSIEIRPGNPKAHWRLGTALPRRELQAAITEFREAIRLDPNLAEGHHHLGWALHQMKHRDEAIVELRHASQLAPGSAAVHYQLGLALRDTTPESLIKGVADEAISEFREAIRRGYDPAQARFELGKLLLLSKDPAEAAAEFREVSRLKPGDPEAEFGEKVAFAYVYHKQGLYVASTRLLAEAFTKHPQPYFGDDRQWFIRYNAACSAVQAGCGNAKDDPPLDELAKAKLRHQALDWLRADLSAWAKLLESGQSQVRPVILWHLQHWKKDSDLSGIRDVESLARLSGEEQEAWHALWAGVDTLLKRAADGRR
jgi:tetratricopeptide (TPR) repeat protein